MSECRHEWSKTARHPVLRDTHVRKCRACGVVVFRVMPPWEALTAPHDEREDWPDWDWPDPGEGA